MNNSSSKYKMIIFVTVIMMVVALIGWEFKLFGVNFTPPLKVLTLDFAYYNPSSLVLKKFGWLEEAFKPQGTQVKWVQSAGSNRAIEYLDGRNVLNYLTGGSVQFASTFGLAAVLAKANGSQIKSIYVYSRPEWTALVVNKESIIKSVEDLRGKKIAVTIGTDPYLFLLRTLKKFGIKKTEVTIENLQHTDGRMALEKFEVNAWVGLEPYIASSELLEGNILIYRNIEFNSYGFLNVSEKFSKEYPKAVKMVIENYERARKWILDHKESAINLIAEEANLSIAVSNLQFQRNNFENPVIGQEEILRLINASPILLEEQLIKPGTNINNIINDLIDHSFTKDIIK